MGVKKRFSRNDKHYVGMFRISSPSNLFYTVDLKLNSIWSGIPNENGLFYFPQRKGNSMIISRRLMSVVVARSMTICAEFKLLICVFYEGASRCNSFFRSLLPQEFSIFINGTSVF